MKKRRLLSIVLSLCMVLALMPQMAFADTTEDGQFGYTMSDGKVKIEWFYGTGTTVTIPSEINGHPVTAILAKAFQYKNKLTNVTFQSPSNVTAIGGGAFQNCTSLTSITLPNSVTAIGNKVFYRCNSLTSVTIPDSVTKIGTDVFSGCTGLTSVTIPNSVTSIGTETFYNCSSLTSITLPNSVTTIGNNAFSRCSSLTSVTIPDSVTKIGTEAFSGCTGLTSVTIPNSVTSIGTEAFSGCTGLTSIEVDGSNAAYSSEAGVLFTKDKTQLIQYPLGNTNKSYSIPSSVTSIGNYAFKGCTSLESIILPKDLDVTNAIIPDTTTKVRYSLDTERGEVTITEIALGTDKESVAIPDTICGYPVVAVVESEQSKVGAHTCNPREVIKSNALKTAGTCQSEAVYYYSCGICGKVYSGGNTFNGEKDSNNHTGTKKWIQNEKQHKQYWNCCDEVVVDYVDHNWNCGVCSVCDYVCKHTGGEATCTAKAECEYCGEEYGELDSSKHTGGTEIRGAKDATCTEEGYTGDTFCKGCGAKLSAGSPTNKLPHDLVNTPAKEATAAETGNKEYWQCTDCQKYFSDAVGTNEIKLDDTVISKLPPEIIKGKGQTITAGEKKALSFTSNAAYSDFIRVELDGKTLNKKNYTVKEGSTIVTLKADYVATLSAGKHTIGIVSESGTAETKFTVAKNAAPADADGDKKSPQTGDNTDLAPWIALMLLSGAGITGVTAYTRRKRTNE